jgi:hypothetical protein
MHIPPIDNLIKQSTRIFKQLLLAQNALNIGGNTILGFSDNAFISASVGADVQIEPIPLAEVKHYWLEMPRFMLETFHGKLVQEWYECLTALFCLLIDKHFSGERKFNELKRCQTTIDFREDIDLIEQTKCSLLDRFEFDSYRDKVKLINSVFNRESKREEYLKNIHKHIQIRNSIQHKNCTIDNFFLKDLGVQQISLLDNNSKEKIYKVNDCIELSIPEFDYFRRSIVLIGQVWREWNG